MSTISKIFTVFKPISKYQKNLKAHYAKMGVKVLPNDSIVKSSTDGLKINSTKLLNEQYSNKVRKKNFEDWGISFLNPDEIWHKSKRDEVSDKLRTEIMDLYSNKTLNKESLQKIVSKHIPKGNKEIKNFSDFKKDFKGKIPDDELALALEQGAIHVSNIYKNTIYLNFDKLHSCNKEERFYFLNTAIHEARHVIRQRSTNDTKLKQDMNPYKNSLNLFTNKFCVVTRPKEFPKQIEKINTETFLEWQNIGFCLPDKVGGNENMTSLKDLHSNFKKAFQFFSQKEDFELPENFQRKKDALKYMKLAFQGDAESYESESIMRECFDDKTKPTTYEFMAMHYAELGKFFHNQILDTCFEELQKKRASKIKNSQNSKL